MTTCTVTVNYRSALGDHLDIANFQVSALAVYLGNPIVAPDAINFNVVDGGTFELEQGDKLRIRVTTWGSEWNVEVPAQASIGLDELVLNHSINPTSGLPAPIVPDSMQDLVTQAVDARDDAVAAKTAVEAVVATTDGLMATVAEDPTSQFSIHQSATIGDAVVAERARQGITAAQTLNAFSRRGRVAIVGDSISAGPISASPYLFYANARGRLWHDWWFYLTGQVVRSLGNWAVGGKNLQHVRDVQMPSVLAMNPLPDALIIAAGTNNWSDPIDDSWAVLMEIVTTAALHGIRPVLTLLPPHLPSPNFASTWNARVRTFAADTGLPLIDRNTPVKGATEDLWASGLSDDGVHPNDTGHRTMGLAVAADAGLLAQFIASPPDIATSVSDTFNLAAALWGTMTGWTFEAGMGQYWLDRNGWPAINFSVSGAGKTASFTVDATADIAFMAGMHMGVGAFASVNIQALGAADAPLGSSVPLALSMNASSANRDGMVYGVVRAPLGTVKFKVSLLAFGTVWFERPTIRSMQRLG